eukprot:jgi/Bigna1/79717/fgenesh1_pg.64_\
MFLKDEKRATDLLGGSKSAVKDTPVLRTLGLILKMVAHSVLGTYLIYNGYRLEKENCGAAIREMLLVYGIFLILAGIFSTLFIIVSATIERQSDHFYVSCFLKTAIFGNLGGQIGSTVLAWRTPDTCEQMELKHTRGVLLALWFYVVLDFFLAPKPEKSYGDNHKYNIP